MSNEIKQSVRKQAQGALDRVAELEAKTGQIEEAIQQIALATNNRLQVAQNQISHATEILNAIVSILGDDVIENAVQANRVEKAIQQAEALKGRVKAAVEKGTFVVAETAKNTVIDENGNILDHGSFIEGEEFDAEGASLPPGYVFLRMSELWPEAREMVVGQKAGVEIPSMKVENGALVRDEEGRPVHSGGKFIIRTIYDLAQPKAEPNPTDGIDEQPQQAEAATASAE